MAKDGTVNLMECLRRAVLAGSKADWTDGQLLEDYLSRRDEAAVAALVRRHGPMVWGVCLRVLHDHHDAEDAFQATFLVLVRKAASVVPREMVGNWLYGVAHQTALKARATAAKRQARERQVKEMPEPAARPEPDLGADLEPLLDQELSRLPDKYRVAVVLCDLEGKTRKEAARQLKIPEGTLSTRLRAARAMMAKRLARHGLAVSGGTLATVLTAKAASAGVPTSVAYPAIKAVTLVAAGQAAAGVTSAKVAALTEGVMKAMLLTKLKTVLGVVLIVGLLATGTTFLTCCMVAGQDNKTFAEGQDDEKPVAGKPMEPAANKVQEKQREAFTAWGKEVDGLQAGLGFPPGQQRAYHYGDYLTLVVRVRNVGKQEVRFQYLKEFLDFEAPLMVTDVNGKTMPQGAVLVGGPDAKHVPVEMSLAAGKEIELGTKQFILRQAGRPDRNIGPVCPPLQVGTGKVSVQFDRVFGNTHAGRIKVDPDLLKLATGKLELEIKPKETPWGEEVEGLQCQLRAEKTVWKPGDQPAFKLVVRDKGKRALEMHMAADGCEVEFDGSWFRWQAPVSIIGGRWPAGKQYDDFEIPIVLKERWGTASGKRIKLSPGRHTVRVAFVTFDKNPVRAVSNAVEIEITAPAKDDKAKVQEQKDVKNQQAKVLELTDADNGKTCVVEPGELIGKKWCRPGMPRRHPEAMKKGYASAMLAEDVPGDEADVSVAL